MHFFNSLSPPPSTVCTSFYSENFLENRLKELNLTAFCIIFLLKVKMNIFFKKITVETSDEFCPHDALSFLSKKTLYHSVHNNEAVLQYALGGASLNHI